MGYDFLVIATGTVPQIDLVEGLEESLEANVVCTTHLKHKVPDATALIESFNGGMAAFTHPRDPTACTTATHTAMFLADQFWERKNLRRREVSLFNGLDTLYPVSKFRKALEACCERDAIDVSNGHDLVKIECVRLVVVAVLLSCGCAARAGRRRPSSLPQTTASRINWSQRQCHSTFYM